MREASEGDDDEVKDDEMRVVETGSVRDDEMRVVQTGSVMEETPGWEPALGRCSTRKLLRPLSRRWISTGWPIGSRYHS